MFGLPKDLSRALDAMQTVKDVLAELKTIDADHDGVKDLTEALELGKDLGDRLTKAVAPVIKDATEMFKDSKEPSFHEVCQLLKDLGAALEPIQADAEKLKNLLTLDVDAINKKYGTQLKELL